MLYREQDRPVVTSLSVNVPQSSYCTGNLLRHGTSYLIYPTCLVPSCREQCADPGDYGMPFEPVNLENPDRVLVKLYVLVQKKNITSDRTPDYGIPPAPVPPEECTDEQYARSRPTIIYFHGNAGNMGDRLNQMEFFFNRLRCNIVMLEYRGYGLSDGYPSERGIRMDAQSTLDYVLKHPILGKTPIVVYGHSFGGGVAIDLASHNTTTIHSLIIENTFTSVRDVAAYIVPSISFLLPVLLRPKWNSLKAIRSFPRSMNILMLSGQRDCVIPPVQMLQLWQALEELHPLKDGPRGVRQWKEFPFASHDDCSYHYGFHGAAHRFLVDILGEVVTPP